MTKLKVLLFTKRTCWCDKVVEFCERNFDVVTYSGERGDKFPYFNFTKDDKIDYVISYLSPWILPSEVLSLAKIAAINFHPGPPKYPGIGGYNFALYNGDTEYGVLCHKMEEKVDTGRILKMRTFTITENETVESLKEKSMVYLLALFYDFMQYGNVDHFIDVKWAREPYTRKDLQDLCNMSEQMTDLENWKGVPKWYNACYFPNAQDKPYIEANGKKYYIIREDHIDKNLFRWKLPSNCWNTT